MSDEAPIIPLRVIQGGGAPVPPLSEQHTPLPEDMTRILALDQQVIKLLVELGKLDEAVYVLLQQKGPLYERLKLARTELLQAAEAAARHVGIDPKDTSKAWNLDLTAHRFERTK